MIAQTKLTCAFCESERMEIGQSWNIRGQVIHPWTCRDCGKVATRYASKAAAARWAEQHGILRIVKTSTLERIDAGMLDVNELEHMQPCEVCGDRGTTEIHHWAPWHLFPDDADQWPTSRLCRTCHQRWHQVVTPNMSRKRNEK